jgi:hypothetical protein
LLLDPSQGLLKVGKRLEKQKEKKKKRKNNFKDQEDMNGLDDQCFVQSRDVTTVEKLALAYCFDTMKENIIK